jgi:ABC-2 type transport system permease protein
MLRRERLTLVWWLFGAAFLVIVQSTSSQSLYNTPEKLAQLQQTLGSNVAVIAMSGPKELLNTIGGEVTFEIFTYAAVVIALMNMFLIGRHTRSDEEAGRAELIRSTRVGRHAPLTAALSLAVVANLAVAVLMFAATAGTGLPASGSIVFALALAGVGVTFAGTTAVAVQVFENPRAVYGAVGALLGASYVLRAVGDSGDGTLSWLSPIGWGQQTLPFVANRVWPLLLPVVAAVLLTATAFAMENRRDIGAGLIPTRPGRATAPPSLSSPLGLAWRLQRGSLIGWTVGLLALGVAYGSVANTIEEFVVNNPEIAEFFPGGTADIVDSYLSFTMLFTALIAACYGISSTLRARSEETAGRAEPLLATPTTRSGWLSSHVIVAMLGSALVLVAAGAGEGLAYALTISDAAQIPRMMWVGLAYAPAVWVLVAVAVLTFGWLPRAVFAVAWSAIGFCFAITIFADLADLPGWARNLSPFAHIPAVPFENLTATPLVALTIVVAGVLAMGFAGFRQRDVG